MPNHNSRFSKTMLSPAVYNELDRCKRQTGKTFQVILECALLELFRSIQAAEKSGRTLYFYPTYKKGRYLHVWIPADMHEIAKEVAEVYHVSLSSVFSTAIMNYLEERS
jgi:hypothetical protein